MLPDNHSVFASVTEIKHQSPPLHLNPTYLGLTHDNDPDVLPVTPGPDLDPDQEGGHRVQRPQDLGEVPLVEERLERASPDVAAAVPLNCKGTL